MSDFAALRAVLALREHPNLSAAARALGWPKSTLSRRLSMLEGELGQRLTRQEGGRLLLSDAGLRYAGYAQRILALAEEARCSLSAEAQAMEGALRVWVSPEMTSGWATRVLNDFLIRHPRIRLEVTVVPKAGLPGDTGVDVWIACGEESRLPGLRHVPLGQWTRRLYASVSGTCRCAQLQTPEELLDGCSWVELAGESPTIALRRVGAQEHCLIEPQARLKVDSLPMQADVIARGYGIGILPAWLAECPKHGLKGRFRPVLQGWEAPPLSLSLKVAAAPRAHRVDALIAHLRASLPPRWALPS